jgi:hypothetical protein
VLQYEVSIFSSWSRWKFSFLTGLHISHSTVKVSSLHILFPVTDITSKNVSNKWCAIYTRDLHVMLCSIILCYAPVFCLMLSLFKNSVKMTKIHLQLNTKYVLCFADRNRNWIPQKSVTVFGDDTFGLFWIHLCILGTKEIIVHTYHKKKISLRPEIVLECFCTKLHTNLGPKKALYFRLPDELWAQ